MPVLPFPGAAEDPPDPHRCSQETWPFGRPDPSPPPAASEDPPRVEGSTPSLPCACGVSVAKLSLVEPSLGFESTVSETSCSSTSPCTIGRTEIDGKIQSLSQQEGGQMRD